MHHLYDLHDLHDVKVKISSVLDSFAINDEFLTGNEWLKTSEMTAGSLRLVWEYYIPVSPVELTIWDFRHSTLATM